MDNRQYKNAFQNIHFSENLGEKILDEIHNVSKRNVKPFHKIIYTGVAAAFCILALCLSLPAVSSYQILSRNARTAICDIQKFSVQKGSDLEHMEIKKNEMILIDTARQLEQNQMVSFAGHVEGDSLNYEIGYVYNDQYSKLDTLSDTADFEETFCTTEQGSYYLCISNYSSDSLRFDGNIQVNTNDLTYRADTIYLSDNTTITIQAGTIPEPCIAYYIENCQTKKNSKIPVSTKKAINTADGSYRIFGITSSEKIIDLKDCISIEQSVTQSENDAIIPLQN